MSTKKRVFNFEKVKLSGLKKNTDFDNDEGEVGDVDNENGNEQM